MSWPKKGFVLTADEAHDLNRTQDAFIKYNTVTPVFVKPGGWKAGDTLVQKDLANTLKRIRDKGMAGFLRRRNRPAYCGRNEKGKWHHQLR